MVHPGIIVAVSFGVVATGVVLFTIFKEEFHDLFEKPSAIPGSGSGRSNNQRRNSGGNGDSESYSTARDGSYYGYELRSRQGGGQQSDDEKEKDDDDDNNDNEHERLLKQQREISRREQELNDKMARLDEQERLLNEREKRLKQQQFQAAAADAHVVLASPPSPPNELSQSEFLMPVMDYSQHSQERYSTPVQDPFADSSSSSPHQQHQHPLSIPLSSPSSPVPAPAPLPVPAPTQASTRSSSADAILRHNLSEQRNPFEESSIYMDISSSASVRDDHTEEQHQQHQQQALPAAHSSHDDQHVAVGHEGEETTSSHGGIDTLSDPEWTEADIDSDQHSNFSDYDDWSSSTAQSP